MKITSQHHHIWPHGFSLQVGENLVDEAAIPKEARARLRELEKFGAITVERESSVVEEPSSTGDEATEEGSSEEATPETEDEVIVGDEPVAPEEPSSTGDEAPAAKRAAKRGRRAR